MLTPLEIAGMVALAAAILGAGFLIQRLDSALVGDDAPSDPETDSDEDEPETSTAPAAKHAPSRHGRKRRHGR